MTLSNNTLETTDQIPAAMRMWEWIDTRLAEAKDRPLKRDGDPLPPLKGDAPHNVDHHVRVVANLKGKHSPESVKASLNHLLRHKELGHNVIGMLGATQQGDSYLGNHRSLPYGRNNKATKIYGDVASNPKDVVRVAKELSTKTRNREVSPAQFRAWLYKRLHAKHVGGVARKLAKRDSLEGENVPIGGGDEEGGEVSQLHHGKGLSGGAAGGVAKRNLPDPWVQGLDNDELKSLGLKSREDKGNDHNLPLQKLVNKSKRALQKRYKDDPEKLAGIHKHIAKTLDMTPDQLTRVFTHGSPERSIRGAKPGGKGASKQDKFLARAERASQKKKIHKLFGDPKDTSDAGDVTTKTTYRGKPAHFSGPPVRKSGEDSAVYLKRLAKWEKKSKSKKPQSAGTEPFGVKLPGYDPTYASKKLKGGKQAGDQTPSDKERSEKLPTGGPSYVRLGGQWVSLKPGEPLKKERETGRNVIKAIKRAVFKGSMHKNWPDAPARKPKLRAKPSQDEGEEDWRFQKRVDRWEKDKKRYSKDLEAWKEDYAKVKDKPLSGKSIAKEIEAPEGKAGEQAVSRALKSIRRRARLELGGRGVSSPLPVEAEGKTGKGKAAKRGARTAAGRAKAAKAGRDVHPDWKKIPVPELKPSNYRRERIVPPEAVKAMRVKRVGPAAKSFASRVTGSAKSGGAIIKEPRKAGPLTRAQLAGRMALQTDAERSAARVAASKAEREVKRRAAAEKQSAARAQTKSQIGRDHPAIVPDPDLAREKASLEKRNRLMLQRANKSASERANYWEKVKAAAEAKKTAPTEAGKERGAALQRGERKVLKLGSKPHQYQDSAALAKAKRAADIRRAQAHFAKAKSKHAMDKALAPARAAEKAKKDKLEKARRDAEIISAGRPKTKLDRLKQSRPREASGRSGKYSDETGDETGEEQTESLYNRLFSNKLVETTSLFGKVFA